MYPILLAARSTKVFASQLLEGGLMGMKIGAVVGIVVVFVYLVMKKRKK